MAFYPCLALTDQYYAHNTDYINYKRPLRKFPHWLVSRPGNPPENVLYFLRRRRPIAPTLIRSRIAMPGSDTPTNGGPICVSSVKASSSP
jgi:hypothetical protein